MGSVEVLIETFLRGVNFSMLIMIRTTGFM